MGSVAGMLTVGLSGFGAAVVGASALDSGAAVSAVLGATLAATLVSTLVSPLVSAVSVPC